ncbi:unnamed protein product, partial [Mesorhabditis spiculigera]
MDYYEFLTYQIFYDTQLSRLDPKTVMGQVVGTNSVYIQNYSGYIYSNWTTEIIYLVVESIIGLLVQYAKRRLLWIIIFLAVTNFPLLPTYCLSIERVFEMITYRTYIFDYKFLAWRTNYYNNTYFLYSIGARKRKQRKLRWNT